MAVSMDKGPKGWPKNCVTDVSFCIYLCAVKVVSSTIGYRLVVKIDLTRKKQRLVV